MEAETRAGLASDVLETARALMAKAPLPERHWALLAKALHQTGRRAEALAALKRTHAWVKPARCSMFRDQVPAGHWGQVDS
jgi:DNA-binding SARP family transcriptional activator